MGRSGLQQPWTEQGRSPHPGRLAAQNMHCCSSPSKPLSVRVILVPRVKKMNLNTLNVQASLAAKDVDLAPFRPLLCRTWRLRKLWFSRGESKCTGFCPCPLSSAPGGGAAKVSCEDEGGALGEGCRGCCEAGIRKEPAHADVTPDS